MQLNILVGAALFTAIVVVLQFLGFFLRFTTFSISLVLMPIVVGAALYGVFTGAWLGLVFGVVVLLTGDAALFLGIDAIGTIVTVLAKGVLAGLCAGAVYKLFEHKNKYAAVLLSSIVCPVVNSGVFILGCRLFFFDAIQDMAGDVPAWRYIILVMVGVNFLIELGINLVLNPVIVRLVDLGKSYRSDIKIRG